MTPREPSAMVTAIRNKLPYGAQTYVRDKHIEGIIAAVLDHLPREAMDAAAAQVRRWYIIEAVESLWRLVDTRDQIVMCPLGDRSACETMLDTLCLTAAIEAARDAIR